MAVGRLAVAIVNALAFGARVDAERPRVAHVAVDLARAGVALNARRPTQLIEANGVAAAAVVHSARLTVLRRQGRRVHGRLAEPRAADAHDPDKASRLPRSGIGIGSLRVHALVVARETRILKSRTALQTAALLAPGDHRVVAALVVGHLVQRHAAVVVARVLAVWVGTARGVEPLARRAHQRIAIEHLEGVALDCARHRQRTRDGWAIGVVDVVVAMRRHRGPIFGPCARITHPPKTFPVSGWNCRMRQRGEGRKLVVHAWHHKSTGKA